MSGLLLFVAFLSGAVIAFKIKRRKEIEAFLDADFSDFMEFRKRKADGQGGQLEALADVVGVADEADPKVVALGVEHRQAITGLRRRETLFDENTRQFLLSLDQVLSEDYLYFVNVMLEELVRVEEKDPVLKSSLRQRVVSMVVCKRTDLSVLCAVQLNDGSSKERQTLTVVERSLAQAGLPLLVFARRADYAPLEIKEKLEQVIPDSLLSRHCPRCGTAMAMRKYTKGSNAGRSFWVCRNYPDCKGIVRIQT